MTALFSILRYGQWAAGLVVLLATAIFGWTVKGWADKAARLDAAVKAQERAQSELAQERADRARVDLARLAASSKFSVTVEQIDERTTILYRNRDRLIPVDRPCLPDAAVEALNEGRK